MATITVKIESESLARQVIETLFSLECHEEDEEEVPAQTVEAAAAPPPTPEETEVTPNPFAVPEPIDNGFGTSIEEIEKENRF